MASFVIHSIAGERFLHLLQEKYDIELDSLDKNNFLLGNLIVDSSKLKNVPNKEDKEARHKYRELVQYEKVSTHFRDENDSNLCIQKPNLSKFETKYKDLLEAGDISAIGYLFHLYTDKMFFDDLFVETFETLDENMNPTIFLNDTKKIRIKKNNNTYNNIDFWDGNNTTSIYHDYTIINKILLEYYGTTFDKDKMLENISSFINPGIEEVDYSNIETVLNKTSVFIAQSYIQESSNLNVFDETKIIEFIDTVANSFIESYQELLTLLCSNKSNTRIKKQLRI